MQRLSSPNDEHKFPMHKLLRTAYHDSLSDELQNTESKKKQDKPSQIDNSRKTLAAEQ